MKTKLFTLLFAVAASVGTMFAWDYERVQIGDLYYNLDATSQTAEVTSQNSSYPFWSTTITTAIIPASVEYNSVTYSVTSIGNYAFYNCTSLTSVTIPNSVTEIGVGAFAYCTGLTTITVDTANPNYCDIDGVLFNKDKTALIQYPAGKSATEYAIPNSVTSIGMYAFRGCTGLTSITIPNSITSIGNYAFSNCTSLTSVTIPNSVTSIGEWAFSYCTGLTSVTIGNSVTSIGEGAFGNCIGLTSVTIPNSVTSIGGSAFDWCTGLTSITIPNSVTSIGGDAFRGCTGLTTVTIPNSVTSIGDEAFAWCTGLTSVIIPNSVTSIGMYAFFGCTSLPIIDNIRYADAYLIEASDKTLSTYTIKEGTRFIGWDAFYNCSSLTSVTIPNSVTSIGEYAFGNCIGLTSVTIPNSVTSIERYAFYYCTSLTSITCEAAAPPTCGEDVFDGVDKSIPLYVPAGSVGAYKAADQWKDFGDNIQPIQAPEADVTDLEANPTDNAVVIAWSAVTGATVYTIDIRKDGELVCTLSFNESGQLLNISFAKHANKNGQARTALQTATGWKYTITGLDSGTEYTYTVIAKNGETELFNESKTFTTTGISMAIDEIVNRKSSNRKLVIGGHLYILRDGHTYTVTGAEVK